MSNLGRSGTVAVEEHLVELDTGDLFERFVIGENRAFGEIWRRHYRRMRAIARRYLQPYRELRSRYEADDFLDDVVGRLTKKALRGELVRIGSSGEFWALFRKVLRQCIREEHQRLRAGKRGGEGMNPPVGEGKRYSLFGWRGPDVPIAEDLDLIGSGDPDPEILAMTEETIGRLFDLLDEEQALISHLRLALFTVPEIKERTGLSERTIARRLKEIRRIWKRSGLLD
jgi:RNA polymerase sigma factor (sigma-70 family)